MPTATTFSVTLDDRTLAHDIATALQDLIDPAPDALTLFEARLPRAASGAPAGLPHQSGKPAPTRSGWRVDAYYTQPPSTADLTERLAAILGVDVPAFEAIPVPEENWVALSQAALPPVRAGRFVIHGSHDRDRIGHRPLGLEIEAGEAFGTAHHPTTLGCLLAIDQLCRHGLKPRASVLDLGCGSGILAIALAKARPDANLLGIDIDQRSVEVAHANARHNGLPNTLQFETGAGLSPARLARRETFDLVIANILAGPLMTLAPSIAKVMLPSAPLILSGILNPQANAVIAAYRSSGFTIRQHRRIGEWSTLTLQRR